MVFFLVVVIADACFFVDGAEAVCGSGFVEDCLCEGGLAAAAVPEKDDVTNVAGIGHFLVSGIIWVYVFS